MIAYFPMVEIWNCPSDEDKIDETIWRIKFVVLER